MTKSNNVDFFVASLLFMLQSFTVQGLAYNKNISYGSDPEQILDIYVPPNMELSQIKKVVLFIHGGAWSSGEKEDMYPLMEAFPKICPTCGLITTGYRLGSPSSPGYPKQLDDIQLAINFLKGLTNPNAKLALLGASAGGHLAMMHSYKFGQQNNVKVMLDIVGPADFTEPNFAHNHTLNLAGSSFFGPYSYSERPELYKETSPVTWITAKSPPTICFYGKSDPIIPISQGTLLKAKLDSVGVPNELTYYEGGHFVDWKADDYADMLEKMEKFLNVHFK